MTWPTVAKGAGRYGLASATIALALALKLALAPWVEHDTPFLLFFAAVLVAGWFGGLGPGLFATALAAASSAFFFMAPYFDFRIADPSQRVRAALFVVEGVFISAFAAVLQRARARADAAAEQARRLERTILQTSERTRREVGHDLHEGLGQHLAGAALRVRLLARRLQASRPADAAEAETVHEMLGKAVSWTRDLSQGLSPVSLRDDGLPAALEELACHTEKTFKVACSFHGEPPPEVLGPEAATHLFYIAQEAVQTAARDGRPSRIRLTLASTGSDVVIAAEDDGAEPAARGAPPEMTCRAALIGARLDVRSLAPHGKIVTCFYPRPPK